MHKQQEKEMLDVAARNYEPSDYKRKDTLSSGLAVTHEQVSDTFAEGNSDAIIDNYEGEDIKIKQEKF